MARVQPLNVGRGRGKEVPMKAKRQEGTRVWGSNERFYIVS